MMSERLRLRAIDADDLSVIAACLQDALIPLAEMAYVADQRRFLAAFTRFRRECLADPTLCDGLTQCQSVLSLDQVEAVKHSGLDERFGGIRLELLTILVERGEDGLTHVTLVFAGDAAIQLRVREIAATLEDFGEPWSATALPVHDLVPAEAEES
jgi:hypothetical protein